jgi:hypothetical protein
MQEPGAFFEKGPSYPKNAQANDAGNGKSRMEFAKALAKRRIICYNTNKYGQIRPVRKKKTIFIF